MFLDYLIGKVANARSDKLAEAEATVSRFVNVTNNDVCGALWHCTCIDLSHIPTNNGTESRFAWTKIQQMYENVHPSLALVLLFVHTEEECGKGLLTFVRQTFHVNQHINYMVLSC